METPLDNAGKTKDKVFTATLKFLTKWHSTRLFYPKKIWHVSISLNKDKEKSERIKYGCAKRAWEKLWRKFDPATGSSKIRP